MAETENEQQQEPEQRSASEKMVKMIYAELDVLVGLNQYDSTVPGCWGTSYVFVAYCVRRLVFHRIQLGGMGASVELLPDAIAISSPAQATLVVVEHHDHLSRVVSEVGAAQVNALHTMYAPPWLIYQRQPNDDVPCDDHHYPICVPWSRSLLDDAVLPISRDHDQTLLSLPGGDDSLEHQQRHHGYAPPTGLCIRLFLHLATVLLCECRLHRHPDGCENGVCPPPESSELHFARPHT